MRARVNLLVGLEDARFAQPSVHHELEALAARGVRPVREHRAPERILAWIDAAFGGTWSTEAARGGVWIAEDEGGPIAFAAYDARGLDFAWLRRWRQEPDVGIVGPLGVVAGRRGTGLGATLLRASLFSLRERGYRRALVPCVDRDAAAGFYERAAGAHVVETVNLERAPRRTTVLASGNGSNFQAVLDAAAGGRLPVDVRALVVNRRNAYALERAAAAGVPSRVVAWDRAAETREAYDARVLAAVAETEPELVLLLGWMHVLAAPFLARFPNVLNLHPAFLPLDPRAETVTMPDGVVIPAYRGARAVDDALADGSTWLGATVHRVGVAVDRGEVVARAPLRTTDGEPRAALDARLHAAERTVVHDAIARWSFERA